MSPIVITVKRNKTAKLALVSKILHKSIHENIYQSTNIDNLFETIQQNINTNQSNETAYFSTLDLKDAYSELNLDAETSRPCNFNIVGGECTRTYCFIPGFYGLISESNGYISIEHNNTHCFLEDIIVINRGSIEDHIKLVYKCLNKIDEDSLRTILPKCHLAKTEVEWLGYNFSQSGIAPIETKISTILNLTACKNLKQLRSFFRSLHYLGKFILNLSSYVTHFEHFLKKN